MISLVIKAASGDAGSSFNSLLNLVKAIFEISKIGKIAGCSVKDGIIQRGANVAVMRNGEVVFETKCSSLKQEKENVKEVQSGKECGVGLEKIEDVKQGDMLEFFTIKDEKKTL